jgi:tetratricopeptide (TPR) repeat protein
MTSGKHTETDAEIAKAIARELIDGGRPCRITVRSLRDRFGRARLTATGRRQVSDALESMGVVVEPRLEHASLDEGVVLRLRQQYDPVQGRRRTRLAGIGSRAWKGVAAFVSLVGTLAGLYAFFDARTSKPPVERLAGDLNVAVAPFTATSAQGQVQGEQIARQVRTTLEEQLKRRGRATGVSFDIAPPPAIKPVVGATQEERAASAQGIASRVTADVVVYAAIRLAEQQTVVVPSFFLSGRTLGNAEEMIGGHRLGAALTVPGSVTDSPAARVDIRRRLATTTRVLSEFVVGLSYFGRHEYAAARRWFREAERTSAAAGGNAEEVIYLFLGHTAGRMGALGQAERFYERALDADPEYGRARFGLAEVQFQRAKHGCQRARSDEHGLRAALRGYMAAEGKRGEAYGKLLRLRSRFGQARVLLCLSAAGIERRWTDAEALFRQVVRAYDGGEPRLRDEASEALAAIGLIREPSGRNAPKRDLRTAADYYERALRLSGEKNRQAFFSSKLGSIYAKLGEIGAAERAYRLAVTLDPDPEDRRRYENELRDLNRAE